MLLSSGRLAIVSSASLTDFSGMRGSGFIVPSACGTPPTMRSVMSLAALPMSI
jgi:hypothetical protein